MEPITSKLRRTRLFANLPEAGLIELIERPGVQTGDQLDIVPARPGDLVVLLEGGLHMLARDGDGSPGSGDHLAILSVDAGSPEPGILYTIPVGAVLRLTRTSHYLIVDGDRLDRIVSSAQEQKSLGSLDDEVRERVAALIRAAPFKQLTFDQVVRCAEAMQIWNVAAGEDVIQQGEPGDYFYVLESGSAEVVRRTDASTQTAVAMLRVGSTFGEEALLQGGVRNATVRMVRDGRVLRLDKGDFDRLLKPGLVAEITPDDLRWQLTRGGAQIIDCRNEEEWELWRLPSARLMPLETLRERARGLDRSAEYIVYCRTGRRSTAAVFLMRQMGLKARSLRHGIAGWPYEFEGLPLNA